LAGFGTVGSAVYRNLNREADLILERTGILPEITAIAVRNPRKSRPGGHFPSALVVRQPRDLVKRDDVDIIVEVMGGCTTARDLIFAALRAHKPVVTANKALLAEHGRAIFGESNRLNVPIYFEASVAGGIPIIQSLRQGLVANRFHLIYGIVNGTCNYILTKMSEENLPFEEVLREAQALGYAEADPSFDIDGVDAAHKAAILASLAHGGCVDFHQVHMEGIRNVSSIDVQFGHLLGYEIKLLAIIRWQSENKVEVRVHPTLIPRTNRLAATRGVTNAIVVRGHVVGDIKLSGPGAGGDATSSAILSNIVEAATHLHSSSDDRSPAYLCAKGPEVVPISNVVSRYYLRLSVADRPGVMAQISSILGKAHIGISSVIQPEGHEGKVVPLIFMIHDARFDAMNQALKHIQNLQCVKAKPVMLRVESFES